MVCVGSSVAVSAVLVNAPLFTAQALRYAGATVLLLALARVARRSLPWPRGTEWAWLIGIATTGLVLFNVALVRGAQNAEPAVLGVAVACVPIVLAVGGALFERRRPTSAVLAAAVVVTTGAAMVEGGGRTNAAGLGWAAVVLLCEAAFTLLAIPILRRLGPWAVSVHATWLATLLLAGLSLAVEGPHAVTTLSRRDILTMTYLAVVVTAIAFILWYSTVRRLGSEHAGLLTGIAPAAAAISGVLLSGRPPGHLVWGGICVVGAGLVLGLRHKRRHALPSRTS